MAHYYLDVPVGGGDGGDGPGAAGSAGTVRVEVDPPPGELIPAAGGDRVQVGRLSASFEAAMDRIRPMAEAITGRLAGMRVRPDTVTAQFGMKVSADAGVVVARTAGEAQITVTLTWGKEG